jgi:hypothetical protein
MLRRRPQLAPESEGPGHLKQCVIEIRSDNRGWMVQELRRVADDLEAGSWGGGVSGWSSRSRGQRASHCPRLQRLLIGVIR